VVVSPFFLQSTEVTVKAYRMFADATVTEWSGSSNGAAVEDYCTYTTSPGPHEDWPVNCVTKAKAAQYCETRGGSLPTEAQFEYAASNLKGQLFVWGDEEPESCGDAVLGRVGYGLYASALGDCKPASPPGGPLTIGMLDPQRTDRLNVESGTVWDLVGNVSEWSADSWNRQTESCWTQPGVYRDPTCSGTSVDGPFATVRGGSWLEIPAGASAASRAAAIGNKDPEFGFRCARPDD
jgi:formylglycine-generating enzyme required for sulfatase activity